MTSVRRKGDLIRVSLDREEAVLLVSLISQVAEMLEVEEPPDPGASTFDQMVAGFDGSPEQPNDPILQRLLPDAYRDDPEAAEEFRRLTDSDLRAAKSRSLHRLVDDVAAAESKDGGKKLRIDLDDDAAESWLHAINDVRLALGIRLDIREEDPELQRANADSDDERASYAIYDWLTWMQEAIVRPLMGG